MFLNLTFAYLTINLPFRIVNGKTLYGTADKFISESIEFHQTMDLIEIMETTIRLNQSGIIFN